MARLLLLGFVLLVLSGCVSADRMREAEPAPDQRLDYLLAEYREIQAEQYECFELRDVESGTTDCARLMREFYRLYAEFPHNPRVQMSAAAMAYESGQVARAQFLLDQLLGAQGSHPEAAILRSQIALEEGNPTLAIDLLSRQIRMAPARADLREAQAAAYYVEGRYPQARIALGLSGRLGAPGWRISYHQGLICESELKWAEACRFYATALEQKGDFVPAQARLMGLAEHLQCRNIMEQGLDSFMSLRDTVPNATPASTATVVPLSLPSVAGHADAVQLVDQNQTRVVAAPNVTAMTAPVEPEPHKSADNQGSARDTERTQTYGPVTKGDTLYSIARSHLRSEELTEVHNYSDAIVAFNPQIFIGGNPNLLRVGCFLKMPPIQSLPSGF